MRILGDSESVMICKDCKCIYLFDEVWDTEEREVQPFEDGVVHISMKHHCPKCGALNVQCRTTDIWKERNERREIQS